MNKSSALNVFGICLVLGLLLVGGIVGVVELVNDDKPVKVCDAERLMKGYTGETRCYDYYEKEGIIVLTE